MSGQSAPLVSCSAGPSDEVARNSVPAPTSQATATARSTSPRPLVCQAAFMAFWRAPTTPRPAQSRPTRPMIVAVRALPRRSGDGVLDHLGGATLQAQVLDHGVGEVGVAGGQEADRGDPDQEQGEQGQEPRQRDRRRQRPAADVTEAVVEREDAIQPRPPPSPPLDVEHGETVPT